jgi:glycerol-3-phosphate dehydrogenase subunit C
VIDDMRDSLDHCVKCTICETFCPVAAVTPLFPGPKYVGPQAERFRAPDMPSADDSLDLCSSCGICTQVCPQGVKIAEINTRARAAMRQERGIPLRDRVIARPPLLGRMGAPVAPLANALARNGLVRKVGEKVMGLHHSAPTPALAGRTFQSRTRKRRAASGPRPVVYFHGCSTNYFEPHVGNAAISVLEQNGLTVIVPRQGCCGLPLQSNGLFDDARKYVRRLAGQLAPYARDGIDIVATSTSCSLMMKREAREILDLEGDADLAVVSERMFDICEYLMMLHDRGELATDFGPVEQTIPYHAPCQQRGHGIGSPALDLFDLIPGLTVAPSDVQCCGIAGTYGLKKEKYDIAMAVGAPLFRFVEESGGERSVCDSETCRWQISHGTGKPSVHPVELLNAAYAASRHRRAHNLQD